MFKLMGKEINTILGAQTIFIWTYLKLSLYISVTTDVLNKLHMQFAPWRQSNPHEFERWVNFSVALGILGNFSCFCFCLLIFIKINFYQKKIFQEHSQSIKQFGYRSGPHFLGTQKNHLNEMVLLSTQIICLN